MTEGARLEADPTSSERVSVVIATFADDRWEQLERAVASVRAQSLPVEEIVLVVDHNEGLFRRAQAAFPDIAVVQNRGSRGASDARNTGIELCSGTLVAFLDDDAVADRDWLFESLTHFRDESVIGVGGKIMPLWQGRPPRWFPEEFFWTVGATYRGMPVQAATVRNVWAGNMVVRMSACARVGGFRPEFGKRGDREDFQAEDTEFCLRAARDWPNGKWIYEPRAVALHSVPARRSSPKFVIARCYHEGRNKILMAALSGQDSTAREKHYFLRTLPSGVIRGITDLRHGDPYGPARSLCLSLGAVAAVVGVIKGRRDARRLVERS